MSNLKTSDRTFSENKENIDYNIIKHSNKFDLENTTMKKYEEDITTKKEDHNHIIKAIMSTIIPDTINIGRNNRLKNNQTLTKCDTLKNDIDIIQSKNSEENKIILNNNYNFNNNKALSAENRTKKKSKNKNKNNNTKTNTPIIESFQNLSELFQSTDSDNEQEEIIIDNVIHSDDDTTLEKKVISNKSIQETYLPKIKSVIPKINLDLIEFNKLKAYQEIDLYSLERRNYKNLSLDENINMIKKSIRKLQKKININSKKVIAMKKYIDDLKNKYILFKKIKTQSSAFNSKVNYISNHEIIDLNQVEEDEDENDIGSDYLNENEEITE